MNEKDPTRIAERQHDDLINVCTTTLSRSGSTPEDMRIKAPGSDHWLCADEAVLGVTGACVASGGSSWRGEGSPLPLVISRALRFQVRLKCLVPFH